MLTRKAIKPVANRTSGKFFVEVTFERNLLEDINSSSTSIFQIRFYLFTHSTPSCHLSFPQPRISRLFKSRWIKYVYDSELPVWRWYITAVSLIYKIIHPAPAKIYETHLFCQRWVWECVRCHILLMCSVVCIHIFSCIVAYLT